MERAVRSDQSRRDRTDLTVRYEDGTECISRQCYAGEVFLCSGQSNMELPMAWVRADYPLEWDREPDPLLRQYKAIPDCDFNGPRSDHDHAFWQGCDAEPLEISPRSPISSDAESVSG